MPKPIGSSHENLEVTEIDRKYIAEKDKITGVALLRINQEGNVKYVTVFEGARMPRKKQKIQKKINKKLDRKIKEVLKDTHHLSEHEYDKIDESKLSRDQLAVWNKLKAFAPNQFQRDRITWTTSKILSDLKGDTDIRDWKLHKTHALMRKDYEKHTHGKYTRFLSKLSNLFTVGSFKSSAEIIEDYIRQKEDKLYRYKNEVMEYLEPALKREEEFAVYLDLDNFDFEDENEKLLLINVLERDLPEHIALQYDENDSIHLDDLSEVLEKSDQLTEKYLHHLETCKLIFPEIERDEIYLDPEFSAVDEQLKSQIVKQVATNLRNLGIQITFSRGNYIIDPKRLNQALKDHQFSELNEAEFNLIEKILPNEKQIEEIARKILFESFATMDRHIVIHFPTREFTIEKKKAVFSEIQRIGKYREGALFYFQKPEDIDEDKILNIAVKLDKDKGKYSVSIMEEVEE